MGRKAGLKTSELYGAMAMRRPLAQEVDAQNRDSNGFRAGYDADGHPTYQSEVRGE
jgi:hypothetical protein